MKTLDIGRKAIDYTMKKKQHGTFCDTDMRGKQQTKNNIEKEIIEVVHRHIPDFR
jgi:ribosomal protein S6